MDDKNEAFKQALDDHHQWPCPYIFKFIVPTEQLNAFNELFPNAKASTRQSKGGKYTSVTIESTMCSSQEVMLMYEKAAQVEGIISL